MSDVALHGKTLRLGTAVSTDSEKWLRVLSADPDLEVRLAVAMNIHASGAILRRVAFRSGRWARRAVAIHPNTDVATLVELAYDRDAQVRFGVASNPHTPQYEILQLIADAEPNVRSKAISHPATPDHIKIIAVLGASSV